MAAHKVLADILNAPRHEIRLQWEKTRLKAAELEAQLVALTAEHAELVQAILVYEAALAPWKQIPDEVLQRIFYRTRPAEPPTCVPFSKTVAPMQLTQVCSKWRAVAHDTPAIWQGLKCAVYLHPDKYERQETIAFIQSWLSRAAYLPLSIVGVPLDLGPGIPPIGSRDLILHGPTGTDAPFHPWLLMGDKFNLVKDVIIHDAPRIRDLHITFPPYYRHTVALLQETVDFPLLEDVVLNFNNDLAHTSFLAPPPRYIFLENTPRLRKLRFGSFQVDNLAQIFVDWSHLTHFETARISPNDFVQILGKMTSLQYCKATLDGLDLLPLNPINPPQPNAMPNVANIPVVALNVANVPNLLPNVANVPNVPAPPNLPNNLNFLPGNLQNLLQNIQNVLVNVAGVPNMPGAPAPNPHFIHVPSLHTLDLTTGPRRSILPANRPLDTLEFPNLKVLSLASDDWYTFSRLLFRTTVFLSEFHLKIQSPRQRDVLKNALRDPALSQLTHLTIQMNTRFFGPTTDETIDPHTLEAIAEGRLMPELHTFQFEGHLLYASLIRLLTAKGFVSGGNTDQLESASVIYPDVGQKSTRPAEEAAAPFQKVKLCRCKLSYMMDPALMKIQELVGTDRFTMEVSDVDQWERMQQIDWNADE
ncbi:hypothetical protein BDN72DRAFT_848753 [Pluteus cervinus]|uniref:Uncharacterized protein n=1 Tax=Pluteus cervinus TaxID=181527 RepID=A0ACD3A9I9_9AGAR|nr:hypothetical protein BDN72DRAFT_848753 [Pluteus cervinus]